MKLVNIFTYILLLSVGTSLLAMEPDQRKSMRVAHIQAQARVTALMSPIAKKTTSKARKKKISRDPLAPASSRLHLIAREFNDRREAAQNLLSFSESEIDTRFLHNESVQKSASAPQLDEFLDLVNEERNALMQQEEVLKNQEPRTPDYSQEYHSAEIDNESDTEILPMDSDDEPSYATVPYCESGSDTEILPENDITVPQEHKEIPCIQPYSLDLEADYPSDNEILPTTQTEQLISNDAESFEMEIEKEKKSDDIPCIQPYSLDLEEDIEDQSAPSNFKCEKCRQTYAGAKDLRKHLLYAHSPQYKGLRLKILKSDGSFEYRNTGK